MPSKLDYLSKYTSAPDVGGDRKAPKKAKKKKKKKDRNDPGPPRRSRVADHSTSVVDDDDDYFRRGARDSDISDGSAHPNAYDDDDDDGPVVVRDASLDVAGSGEAGGGADSGARGVWKTVSVYGSRETQKSADERPSSSSPSDHQKEQQDPPQRRRQRHDSSSEEEDGNEGRQRRRRHDSSSDEEEDNGQNRKRRRQRHDSSSEEEGGGPPPDARGSSDGGSDSGSVAGRGRRHRRRYDSDESDAESGGGSRGRPPRRRRGSDSSSSSSSSRGDRRRRCDSDASSASGGGPRMSSGHRAGLQNAGDFARSEQKLAARKHRDALEMVDRHGTGETVYRGKDGRPTTAGADPVAEAANAEEGRRRLNRGRVQQRAEEARASELAALAGSGFARGEDDDRLEAIRRSAIREDDPMAEHARKRQRQNRRGGDGGSAPPKPVYKGPAPRANRFGIPPGYRWDGVDRGNGFEDKILAKRFSAGRKAEKAYRWSSADM